MAHDPEICQRCGKPSVACLSCENRVHAPGTADLKDAHTHSAHHREEVENSTECRCFYCLTPFQPSTIDEWVDGDQTALCPWCGIDSVLGDASGLPLTYEFMLEMHKRWFSPAPQAKTKSTFLESKKEKP
jgi:hypothetical protein